MHRPTIEEIKADILSGKGGLCYSMNVFIKLLLEALGYSVAHLTSDVNQHSNNHLLTIAYNLKVPGDRYLVDVAGFPTFVPVPLDFKVESPVYFFSFLRYKFLHRDGKVIWCLQKETGARPSKSKEGWTEFCIIDLTPRELSFFDGPNDEIYGNLDSIVTPFHKSF